MFIIMEVQVNADGTIGTIVNTYADSARDTAESRYHLILSSAAISSLPRHTAFMLMDDGRIVKSESYEHHIEPEPVEPEESEVPDGE